MTDHKNPLPEADWKTQRASETRTLAIWITGLLASGGFGALIARDPAGFYVGMLAFTCMRLWLGEPRKNSN